MIVLTAEFLLVLDECWNVLVVGCVDVGLEVVSVEVWDLEGIP